ncbi:hypothetical protein [Methylomicrobium sp. Wu6]|uniref:hypothetical protein n=1 Tax=Methylomicrobium sp. Wu6 TaxID=3107928 RepID=UPI002DD69A67|nr:hypothetical protein [Methylomicrobium sp. Wu6]MEC4749077.1 hypothetical protein [Methylomicrobium sp. Wu6]
MLDGILDDILKKSLDAGEIRPNSPAIRPSQCLGITELSPNSPNSPGTNAFCDDDRHFCHHCRHLNQLGYCTRQRFRPMDDIPRRCEDFTGYPDQIGQQAESEAKLEPATDPLIVTVWTPSGTALMTRADNAEHAEWMRRMNPKPENPAPKPTTPEPDSDWISEAEHNAQGRYFKFLATWPDGSQCYLCQMPRQTVDEMQAQYPTITHIEPIENEAYPDDE